MFEVKKTKVFVNFTKFVHGSIDDTEIINLKFLPSVGDIFDGSGILDGFHEEWLDERLDGEKELIVNNISHTFYAEEHHILITLEMRKILPKH